METTPEERYDLDLLTKTANNLNTIMFIDPNLVNQVMGPLYICSSELVHTGVYCIPISDDKFATGFLGLLHGSLPLKTQSFQISVELIDGSFVGFKVINCKPTEQATTVE